MRIRLIDQDLKSQGKQQLNAIPDGQEQGAGPNKAQKALQDEFSRLMDKIATKVGEVDAPQFSVGCVAGDGFCQIMPVQFNRPKVELEAKKESNEEEPSEESSVENPDLEEVQTAAAKPVVEETEDTEEVEAAVEPLTEEQVQEVVEKVAEEAAPVKQQEEVETVEEQVLEEQLVQEAVEDAPVEQVEQAAVKVQEVSQAASQQVEKEVRKETKEEVQTEEVVEEVVKAKPSEAREPKELSKEQSRPQEDNSAAKEVEAASDEVPVEAEAPKHTEQPKQHLGQNEAGPHEDEFADLDPIQAAAEKVIRELAAQQLAALSGGNAAPEAHTNKAIGLAAQAAAGAEQAAAGSQSGSSVGSHASTSVQNIAAVTDRGAKLAPQQKEVKQTRLPKAFEQRTMERVKEVLKEAAKSRDGKTLSLRLDPPSLGSVKVDITFKDGSLHARLSAESSQVNQLLREKSAELQQMLRKLGIEAETVSVSVRGDDHGFGGENMTGSDDSSSKDESGMSNTLHDASFRDDSSPSLASEAELDHWVA